MIKRFLVFVFSGIAWIASPSTLAQTSTINEVLQCTIKPGYSVDEIKSHKFRVFSLPLYLIIMTILASILMLNIKYNKSRIYNLIIGIMLSAVIYYINYFINLLGSNGNIPVNLSILFPYFILGMFCFVGLVRINEK